MRCLGAFITFRPRTKAATEFYRLKTLSRRIHSRHAPVRSFFPTMKRAALSTPFPLTPFCQYGVHESHDFLGKNSASFVIRELAIQQESAL